MGSRGRGEWISPYKLLNCKLFSFYPSDRTTFKNATRDCANFAQSARRTPISSHFRSLSPPERVRSEMQRLFVDREIANVDGRLHGIEKDRGSTPSALRGGNNELLSPDLFLEETVPGAAWGADFT
jgi:hypothetical protein